MKSPNVPMSSSLATTAPTPRPPPTVIPTNLSNLDNLFNSIAFLPASVMFFTFLVVLTYLPDLTDLTNKFESCLAF